MDDISLDVVRAEGRAQLGTQSVFQPDGIPFLRQAEIVLPVDTMQAEGLQMDIDDEGLLASYIHLVGYCSVDPRRQGDLLGFLDGILR